MAMGRIRNKSMNKNCSNQHPAEWGLKGHGFTNLKICKIRCRSVEEANRGELYRRVKTHVLEAAEAGNQRSAALPTVDVSDKSQGWGDNHT